MMIGSVILTIMLLWGFPALGRQVMAEVNTSIALMMLLIIFSLLFFGTALFMGALNNLGRDYYLPGLFAICMGTGILMVMLFWDFLFPDITESALEVIETFVMTSIGIILFYRGGFYLSKHEPLASSIAEIIGFVIVLYSLLFLGYSSLDLWKSLIMTFAGFVLIFGGFHSFGSRWKEFE